MDEDKQSQSKKRDLPNTPRVCGKILEYYEKFGQDRDLEKFMRLYSPTSSQGIDQNHGEDSVSAKSCISKGTKTSEPIYSKKSCGILPQIPSRPLSGCCEANSKSLPNICPADSNDVTVDINIETDGERILSLSTENLKTPKKTFKSAKTQTPESVAKTHRRLEWDSLGDVGYKKSMSASNISVIERSLLRELFKEQSAISEPSPTSRRDERSIQGKEAKITDKVLSTPPLACSTLVNPTDNGAKPRMLSQSTSSTSLTEKFEKYAQTSIIKPPTVRSQEVQCTLSSSYSAVEGTASPSSFEYYSSSKSKSSKSSDVVVNANTQNNRLKPLEHPFITSITDLLMKRKALGEKSQLKRHQCNDIQNLQTKFAAALDENKENQTPATADSSSAASFSLSKQAPELDLGIQLICSLIEAKSINGRQKKQLIRGIIKRLTHFDVDDNSTTANSSEGAGNASGLTSTNSSSFHNQNVYDSCRSSDNKNRPRSLTKSSEISGPTLKQRHLNEGGTSTTSSTNRSENYSNVLGAQQVKNQPMTRRERYNQEASCEQILPVKSETKKVSRAQATLINKETQSEFNVMEPNNHERKQAATDNKLSAKDVGKKCSRANRCTQTSNASLTTTSSASPTPDLVTQKLKTNAVPELNSSNTDAEQPTMREWLNPLTQSEIEYEAKKQTEIEKSAAAQQEKLMKKRAKHDCGRVQQLSWIEKEIKRLECLKHLLLKDETATKTSTSSASSVETSVHKICTESSYQPDKLYDTVYTDKSSALSESAEQLVHEIEIILEESHEDFINFKDNTKLSKERKTETQRIYETEKNSLKSTKTKPKLHVIDENSSSQERQFVHPKQAETVHKTQKQREKLDTPSTDASKGSESLKDMVRQRKREFMEAYKSKKQHHYDALKQQQQDFKYLNIPQQSSGKSTTPTDFEHYSEPHTLPTKYVPNNEPYCMHHPLPEAPLEKVAKQKPIKHPLIRQTTTSSAANANNSTTNSSSSIFCMSSEISVPMGSQNTYSSTSSTRLNNRDKTAAATTGVAVQTSDSIRLSRPIYGPAPLFHPTTILSSTACIQVKPKGIAYVIEFDDNKQAASSPSSDAGTNSNDLLPESNHSTTHRETSSNAKSSEHHLLTLQQHLEKSKPAFLKHSKERKAILNQLQSMRQERVRQLREIIENTSLNSLDRRLQYLPPPPIQKVRILRTREMKALTNKRFASLPEIVAKQEREVEERRRRSNRIFRDVFNKRLQKRVRSGKLSLNHSKTVV